MWCARYEQFRFTVGCVTLCPRKRKCRNLRAISNRRRIVVIKPVKEKKRKKRKGA